MSILLCAVAQAATELISLPPTEHGHRGSFVPSGSGTTPRGRGLGGI